MLELTSFTYRGITLGPGSPYTLTAVDGWWGAPDGNVDTSPVAGGHGEVFGPLTRGSRTVRLTGECMARADRDELFWALRAAAADTSEADLIGSVAGLTLTAGAVLTRFAPAPMRDTWGRGYFPFAVEWRCPDPLLYGAVVRETSWISTSTAGITYPVVYPVHYPDNPPSGQITVTNPGNAPTPVVVRLVGGLRSPGVAVVATGEQAQWPLSLGETDELVIDTREGVGLLNGEFRSPSVWSALVDDLVLPPGVSRVQALGTATSGAPSMTVEFRPAYF